MLAKSRSAAPSPPPVTSAGPSGVSTPSKTDKPLSKLQAKMLAARQAKTTSGYPVGTTSPALRTHDGQPSPGEVSKQEMVDDAAYVARSAALNTLFAASSSSTPVARRQPSAFASLLVTSIGPRTQPDLSTLPGSLAQMERLSLGGIDSADGLDDLKRAFEMLSPDDVVAEKRKGTTVGAKTGEGPVVAAVGMKGKN